MKHMWAVGVALLIVARTSLAADPAPEEKTGLKVGEKSPEFKLQDQNGDARSLTDLRKDGNVALVFFRSASW